MTKRKAAPPSRRRVSIPAVDISTLSWWEAQDDPSASVRMLVREDIERNGLQDKVNRPVEQLPRRGRPSVASMDVDDQDHDDAGRDHEGEVASVAAVQRAVEPRSAAPSATEVISSRAKPAAATGSDSIDEESIDDIMGNLG